MITNLNGCYAMVLEDQVQEFARCVAAVPTVTRDTAGLAWLDDCAPRELYELVGNIAIISVSGFLVDELSFHGSSWITGYNAIRLAAHFAFSDPEVSAVALLVNSPGGAVSGCFELVDYLHSMRGDKPLMAIVKDMATSAAYLIASAAEVITVPQTGKVGSIGVYRMHADYSAMLDREGIKFTLVHSGERKVDGNSYQPLPDNVRTDWQAAVDAFRDLFADYVARGRGISKDTVLGTEAELFDGPLNIARAGEIGLIDQVMAPDAAFAALVEAVSCPQTRKLEKRMAIKTASLAALLGKPAPDTAADADSGNAEDDEEDDEEMTSDASSDNEAGTDAEAEADDSEDEAAEDDETEDEADAGDSTDAKAGDVDGAFALLNSAEAKGKSDLATQLAHDVAKGDMTVARAKVLLNASAKKSNLSEAMSGRDVAPGTDAPSPSSSSMSDADQGLLATAGRLKKARSGR